MGLYKIADKLFIEEKGLFEHTFGVDPGPFRLNTIRDDYATFTDWWRTLDQEKKDRAVAYVKWVAKERNIQVRHQ